MRREVAARARVHRHDERHRHRQRPHRVGLRLLLEGDRQHPLVHARPGPARRRRSRSTRRPSRPCAPGAAACPRRRARRRGRARASSRPRTGRGPCRRRRRRCRRRSSSASASARSTASRSRPAIETSSRLARWWVWPTPMTAAGTLDIRLPLLSSVSTRFCCSAGPEVAWARALLGLAGPDPPGGLADAVQAGGEHRVGGQRAARRVDRDVVGQAERRAQDQLLVAERRVQLGEVDAVGPGGRGRPVRCSPRWSGRGR